MQREKFVNSMLFKHLILANNDKELVKMLSKSEKSFDLFMEILEDAYELDEDFFGIDSSIPSKVLSVLNYYRFEERYRKKYSDKINAYIIEMNRIDNIRSEDKDNLCRSYLNRQSRLRQIRIPSKYDLLYLLRNDMIVYQTLLDGDMNKKTFFLVEEASTYFMKSCIELYDDDNFLTNSYNLLTAEDNGISKKDNFLMKRLIKEMNKKKK
ncbi:MAG: hypothetical protein IJL76_03400 [Bacilli bacterium]|nr:hypothetical protein [Bacilli bacterium]